MHYSDGLRGRSCARSALFSYRPALALCVSAQSAKANQHQADFRESCLSLSERTLCGACSSGSSIRAVSGGGPTRLQSGGPGRCELEVPDGQHVLAQHVRSIRACHCDNDLPRLFRQSGLLQTSALPRGRGPVAVYNSLPVLHAHFTTSPLYPRARRTSRR